MKKTLFTVLMVISGLAAATDIGIYGGRNMGSKQDSAGVSLGQSSGKIGIQATADRSTTNRVDVNRYTASVSYDVIKLGPVQTNVRVGGAFIDTQKVGVSNGGAAFAGAGVSYPVMKNVNLVADYAYQKGNNITKSYNGNIVTAGVKYSF
jgi:outer membrane autotransporter protein